MKSVTITNLVGGVRSMVGKKGEDFNEGQIEVWLKDAAVAVSRELGWGKATWSTACVAGTDEYYLPDDIVSVEHVSYDDEKLFPIDWKDWSGVTGDGDNKTTQGIPDYYLLWSNGNRWFIKLYQVPSGTKTLKVHYRKRPTTAKRNFRSKPTSAGTDSTIVDTEILTEFKAPGNRSATSSFFNGCQVYIVSAEAAAPAGEYSYVTNFAETTGTLTLDPALSAATATADVYEIQDVLEMPTEYTSAAQYYAASLVCASLDITDKAAYFDQKWQMQLEKARVRVDRKKTEPDKTMKFYNHRRQGWIGR